MVNLLVGEMLIYPNRKISIFSTEIVVFCFAPSFAIAVFNLVGVALEAGEFGALDGGAAEEG